MTLILRLSKNKAGHISGPVVLVSIVWIKTLSDNGIDFQVCLYCTDYTAEKNQGRSPGTTRYMVGVSWNSFSISPEVMYNFPAFNASSYS